MQKILLLTLAACLSSGCAMLYTPNVANVPLHKEKGDVQLSAHAGFMGGNFQASYAASSSMFVNVNANFFHNKENILDYTKVRLGELALGYYRPFGNKENVVFEVSGGYGLAKVHDYETLSVPIDIETNYHKFFIQPSIGSTNDYFDVAFSVRCVGLKYFNYIDGRDSSQSRASYPGMAGYVEPIVTARGGFKYLKFSFQTGLSLFLTEQHPLVAQGFPLMLNVGLNAHFSLRHKDKEKAAKTIPPN